MTAYRRPLRKTYEIDRSPLYGLSSKRKLSEILGVDISYLSALGKNNCATEYRIFVDKKSLRFITEPIGQLSSIHKCLLKLFVRIAPPDYIHSATKGRSYKTNADLHKFSESVLKIDVQKFYPSVKFRCIHSFFLNSLKCAPDIAAILAKICTVETKKHGVHLPTGSCISPILSFLANQKLFDLLNLECKKEGCVFTVYVDDMTVSGANATRAFLTKITTHIHCAGYEYHKIQTYHRVPAMVTGLIVFNGQLSLPHVRAKRIRETEEALQVATNKAIKQKLLASLIGRLAEAESVNAAYKLKRQQVMRTYAVEWQEIVDRRNKKAELKWKSQRPMRNEIGSKNNSHLENTMPF